MKLFHFTAGHLLFRIQAEGLRKGVIPWSMNRRGEVGLVAGWQWLTTNPAFGMEWARPSPFSGRLYRTDEIRIEVNVPVKEEAFQLFQGAIPPNWIVGFEKNPTKDVIVLPELN